MKECDKRNSHILVSSKLHTIYISSNNVRHPVPKTFATPHYTSPLPITITTVATSLLSSFLQKMIPQEVLNTFKWSCHITNLSSMLGKYGRESLLRSWKSLREPKNSSSVIELRGFLSCWQNTGGYPQLHDCCKHSHNLFLEIPWILSFHTQRTFLSHQSVQPPCCGWQKGKN